MAGVSPGREWPAIRRGVAPGLYSIRYSIRRRRVNPLRNLRFRPVTNRWASRVRLGLPARWAGLLSCRSEVTPFRIHQPEHDGPRGFGVIVHNPRYATRGRAPRPPLFEGTWGDSRGFEVLFAFPGGALFPRAAEYRRVPGRVPGAGLEPARPQWRTRDFKSLASADFAIPAFDSPVFRAPPAARSRFVPRAASRPVRTIGPNHRAQTSGGTIGREPASSRCAGVLRGPSGRIVGPDCRAGGEATGRRQRWFRRRAGGANRERDEPNGMSRTGGSGG